jgi:glutamate dehydrogenase (NADP+)
MLSWDCHKVDETLKETMKDIHNICEEYGKDGKRINYIKGANIGGFVRVADALKAYGL